MAHTLTFDDSVYCKVNGVVKDSPYTLRNGDVIKVIPNYTNFVVNGTTYDSSIANTIAISNSDIIITLGSKTPIPTSPDSIINYTEASTPRVSVDLTTLPGYANLSAGEKNITIVAKANGYKDSAPSAAVKVTKAAAGETWVLNETFTSGGMEGNFTVSFTSNNIKYTYLSYGSNPHEHINYGETNVYFNTAWVNEAYRTIVLDTPATGDLLAWLQANGKRAYSVTITKASLLSGTAIIRDGNSASASAIATLAADTDAGITVHPTSGYLYLDYSNSHGEPGYSWYSANWEKPTGDITIDENYLATVTGDGTIEISASYYTCLTGDTLISLADGSQKRIDEIQLTDKVLAYNPKTLTLESDEIIECDSNECKWHTEYDIWTFSDGTEVKTVHRHRFYNVERQAMVYMDEWNIGEHTIRQDGSKTALISHKNIKEKVRHYTIFTKHQNYFANGLLSGNRYTKPMRLC